MTKTCKYCGKNFKATTSRQVYCSDSCRAKAYHARQKGIFAEIQKKAADKAAGEHKARTDETRRRFNKKVKAGDKAARLIDLKARRPFSVEYWQAFKDFEDERDGPTITLVNGVRTDCEDFAATVAALVIEQNTVAITTEPKGVKTQ